MAISIFFTETDTLESIKGIDQLEKQPTLLSAARKGVAICGIVYVPIPACVYKNFISRFPKHSLPTTRT